MLIRRFTCPSCGAAQDSLPDNSFVTCTHCGSFVDWDMLLIFRKAKSPESQKLAKVYAKLMPQLEAARQAGNREAHLELSRKQAKKMIELSPWNVLPKVQEPGPARKAYIESWAHGMLERTFNPDFLALNDLLTKVYSSLTWQTTTGPYGLASMHLDQANFEALVDGLIGYYLAELKLIKKHGLNRWDKDLVELSEEDFLRLRLSGTLQSMAQYLDPKTIEWFVGRYGFRGNYFWQPENGEAPTCSGCGAPVTEATRRHGECLSCSQKLDAGAVPFACRGCGAPLALPPDAHGLCCPWCGTAADKGALDSWAQFRA